MIRKIIGLYYSPIGGTRLMTEKLARDLAGKLDGYSPDKVGFSCFDLTDKSTLDIDIDDECIAVIATPVYLGKIPLPAAKAIMDLKGKGAMTIVSVSFGGYSYGNALFELLHYAEAAGFSVIGAAAFSIFCKTLLREGDFTAPGIDDTSISKFEDAASGKIKRLSGSEIEGLKIKPAPVVAPGRMPVHFVSRYSTEAAALAQRIFEKLSIRKNGSEWFL